MFYIKLKCFDLFLLGILYFKLQRCVSFSRWTLLHMFHPDSFSCVNWFLSLFSDVIWEKTFPTRAGIMWLFTSVGSCFFPRITTNVSSATYFVNTRLLGCNQAYMPSPLRHNYVSHPDGVAVIWFLSSLSSYVDCQFTTKSESSPTFFVKIWLLFCMNSYVLFQVWHLTESFPTCFTRMWFLTCVDSHVIF